MEDKKATELKLERLIDERNKIEIDLLKKDKEILRLKHSYCVDEIERLKQENEQLKEDNRLLEKRNERLTEEYKKKQSIKFIEQWINECLEYTPDELTPFRDLCSYYQCWSNEVYGKNINMDFDEFKEQLLKYQNEKWGGFKKVNHTKTNPKCNVKVKPYD